MPETTGSYFSRAFALIKKEKGWIKVLLICAAVLWVPVLGMLAVKGYLLEWARLIAWGSDVAPEKKSVDIGRCLTSGWRGFIAGAGYTIPMAAVSILLNSMFEGNGLVSTILVVISFAVGMIAVVAELRSAIYQTYGAGYNFTRMKELVQRDTNGLLKVSCMVLLTGLVCGIAMVILWIIVFAPAIGGFITAIEKAGIDIDMNGQLTDRQLDILGYEALKLLGAMIIPGVVAVYITSAISTFVSMIQYGSVALWIRQFDVASWGGPDDPLPYNKALPPAYGYDASIQGYQANSPYSGVYGQQPISGYQPAQSYVPQQNMPSYQNPQTAVPQQVVSSNQAPVTQQGMAGYPSAAPQTYAPQQSMPGSPDNQAYVQQQAPVPAQQQIPALAQQQPVVEPQQFPAQPQMPSVQEQIAQLYAQMPPQPAVPNPQVVPTQQVAPSPQVASNPQVVPQGVYPQQPVQIPTAPVVAPVVPTQVANASAPVPDAAPEPVETNVAAEPVETTVTLEPVETPAPVITPALTPEPALVPTSVPEPADGQRVIESVDLSGAQTQAEAEAEPIQTEPTTASESAVTESIEDVAETQVEAAVHTEAEEASLDETSNTEE